MNADSPGKRSRVSSRTRNSLSKDLSQLRQAYTHALLLAGRHWRRAADAVVKQYGLSDATAHPLVLIARLDDEPRQNALAEAMGVEGPTLVRLLDQLCSADLIIRREDPMDRRAKVLSLTASGQAVVAKIEAELSTLRETVFANVSAADLKASLRVFQALQDLTRTIDEAANDAGGP
ncbi:MarR family transcriptional regulator for hemolysin (modular protein) [Methylocella tundrae]|uniref:MarR family transcriptional regulator for hemolysin (Modular protein) n=1 Tax=Methylocella tundrae TaxID=227605 RepID=A0A8B6M735_METTU|nr:MarR family winged helix-turn-helix transcriptional regulator [Methylocella tundrae]VTZ27190.1 MarR family transcriptional regulator for hemolysin (modular protein) [Methylocella tundrae]VTZ50680.1 MarR family transcriptional regulator for hemolysin (modular protein) [Methylocella tundrae]